MSNNIVRKGRDYAAFSFEDKINVVLCNYSLDYFSFLFIWKYNRSL
ncbi:hypothetical protein DFP98_11455 [Cohnella phaseoli]|uniref:Uncharacterized protein n=1 Tax=Cohnella phaseoli TaxID=456490 RepID=A0A3D9JNW0_9BACL|nr:hypothetical protein DFP98_11455 [Cohnella phaseoli]